MKTMVDDFVMDKFSSVCLFVVCTQYDSSRNRNKTTYTRFLFVPLPHYLSHASSRVVVRLVEAAFEHSAQIVFNSTQLNARVKQNERTNDVFFISAAAGESRAEQNRAERREWVDAR